MTRFCLIGPTHPYRGGIAHYTTLLAKVLREEEDVLLISFSRQYPKWLFPGRSDRDPSKRPLKTEAEFILDPLNPITWRRTLRRIDQWEADVVIIPWWVPFWAPAWSAIGRGVKRLPKRPRLLFLCHNVLPHERGRIESWLLPKVLRFVLRPGDGFIVHAASDREILQRILPSARIEATPHPTYAVFHDDGEYPIEIDLPNDRPLLLFCGFVRPYKGLDVLLDALPMVLQERSVHLLVAGEFWQRGADHYAEQVNRLALNDAVTMIDRYLPNEELAAYMSRADLVVLPYRSATQSGIIQAAFGQNTPVITTNVGGLPDVVENDRTGLVVPAEDPQALACAISRFFGEGLGPQFSEKIQTDSGRFSWDKMVAAMLELVKK